VNSDEIIAICKVCNDVKEVGPSLWCKICKCNIHLKAAIGPALGKRCPQGKW